MNIITIMGRLTKDPERRETQSGTPVTSFSLAVDRGYTPKDGGDRKTDFFDVVAWRNTADFVAKYFVKGQMAAVTGRLEFEDWTDKDNIKRRSAKVVADNIFFTESKKDRDNSHFRNETHQQSAEPQAASDYQELDMLDGDLPF